MRNCLWISAFTFVLLGLMLLPASVHAQSARTWVSGVGDDVNPCSRTAPCKTLAGAISKTAATGIINLLDAAAVGAVTITKSITIQMDSQFGGVLSSGTNGVTINAAVTDTVVLRGLSIHGSGGASGVTGLNGVRILIAGSVRIENCNIQSFLESGIEVVNAGALKLSVLDTSIENISASGAADAAISLAPVVGGSVRAVFDRVRIHSVDQFGINAVGDVRMTLRDSVISDVVGSALRLDGAAGAATAMVDNSTLTESTINGLLSSGAGAVARLNRSVISGNAQGLLTASSGQIISFGNNVIAGNTVNGTPSSTVALQ